MEKPRTWGQRRGGKQGEDRTGQGVEAGLGEGSLYFPGGPALSALPTPHSPAQVSVRTSAPAAAGEVLGLDPASPGSGESESGSR